MKTAIRLVEKGLVPKPLIRRGIRKLLAEREAEQEALHAPDRDAAIRRWVASMAAAEVAPVPEKANEQHYEVPPAFFRIALGARLKYSSAFYADERTTLDEAEEAMLALTCERAELVDGQDVIELGCGWGSLTLWMGEKYPNSRITAVSNSAPQREFILARAAERGITNIEVVTCDMNVFESDRRFDRAVSVEMFEHMRNWPALLRRVRGWLKDDAKLFFHVFAHVRYAYPFEARDESDWMSRYFFTGGQMPAVDQIDFCEGESAIPFEVEERWIESGQHYARTSEDWLRNIERRRADVLAIFRETYGSDQAELWFHRWRVFFLACAELFAWKGGSEWVVEHQRLRASEL
ncbi:Cyclopropane-fatty-acyl-phospholipid synthase [Planctomycetes bacterium Pla163]|uniref:Cyclopropane-fatty-acyl-phospholipid synthase n=1 Tax=Rohdeia mirabilis TaxID=2528008 RepID=A0A518CVQ1_9BACT|nr:Cyclopropane-fatty-acyl-phospholipid synthase [Planctomycetes bacterium Pla163]